MTTDKLTSYSKALKPTNNTTLYEKALFE